MPGFLGFILILCAGHGKLFIADVNGKSASNEIPRFFLFCKDRVFEFHLWSCEVPEMFAVVLSVRTHSGEGSKDSALARRSAVRTRLKTPPLALSCFMVHQEPLFWCLCRNWEASRRYLFVRGGVCLLNLTACTIELRTHSRCEEQGVAAVLMAVFLSRRQTWRHGLAQNDGRLTIF